MPHTIRMFYATNVYGMIWCHEEAESLMAHSGTDFVWVDRTDPRFGTTATPWLCSDLHALADHLDENGQPDIMSEDSGLAWCEQNVVVKF